MLCLCDLSICYTKKNHHNDFVGWLTWKGERFACGFKVTGFVGDKSIPGRISYIDSYAKKIKLLHYIIYILIQYLLKYKLFILY